MPEFYDSTKGEPFRANEMHQRLMMTAVSGIAPPRVDPDWKFVWSHLELADIRKLSTPEEKYRALFGKSQELANQGKLVVVAWKNSSGHGHVAVVVPSEVMETSRDWGGKVPFIAQAGKRVDSSMGFNYGFARTDKNTGEVIIDTSTIGTGPAVFSVGADLQLYVYDP